MALISTLRQRMGKIVVGLIAFSMIAFILTSFLKSNRFSFFGNDRNVGEIAGTDISYEKFQNKVMELSYTFAVNNGRDPRTEELAGIRTQAWNALILEYAYQGQYDELGIKVTDKELVDMVQGNNIDPQIKQFFTDPNTGQFSKENVIGFLQQLKNAEPQQRASWQSFESGLRPSREIKKYGDLLDQTIYVTTAEAKNQYKAQNSNMSVDFFYVPFFSISDSAFTVTQSEMQTYLKEHADEYEREESRSISYVSLPIAPSAADTAFVKEDIQRLAAGLAAAENDSVYATINSEGPNPYRSIHAPDLIPGGLVGAEIGTITEPIFTGAGFAITKLSDVVEGQEAYVKARHILIQPDGNSESAKATAKEQAEDLIRQIKEGGDFAVLAAQYSADQSNAANGGDLGWFGENGSFVESFKDAVFAFNGKGLIPNPVETSYGFHVVQIDEPKSYTTYKVATIEKELFESEATLNEIYRKANQLAANSTDAETLKVNAEEAGLSIKSANNIRPTDTRIGLVGDARTAVMWLYNDASVGDVSDVFELDGTYMIAVMTGKQPEGTAVLSQVESEIKTKVLNQKKAKQIIEKIKGLSGDFDSMKDAYGEGARTGTADLTLSSNSFPNVGFAPEAVGIAFSLEEGEKTAPFEAPNGVLVVSASAKSVAEEAADYASVKSEMVASRRGRKAVIANFPLTFTPLFISQDIDEAVKEFSEIKDERYKYF